MSFLLVTHQVEDTKVDFTWRRQFFFLVKVTHNITSNYLSILYKHFVFLNFNIDLNGLECSCCCDLCFTLVTIHDPRGRLFHRLPCLVLYQICLEVRYYIVGSCFSRTQNKEVEVFFNLCKECQLVKCIAQYVEGFKKTLNSGFSFGQLSFRILLPRVTSCLSESNDFVRG